MKTANTIIKIITALTAIIGAVYILATYGEKMVEWARTVLGLNTAAPAAEAAEDAVPVQEETVPTVPADEAVEPVSEEAPAEEAAAEETPEVSTDMPIADESDFEG